MKRKKKKKKISVFIILFIIIGGVYLFNHYNLPAEKIYKKKEKHLKIVDVNSKSRPLAVMINNHRQARINHAGLGQAYIVYEAIVEGGLTRLMALFKDQNIDKIGSVRSSRHYFLDYAMENDAIYVHYGWSPKAESDIKTYGIQNINGMYDSNAFWRDRTLRVASEHTAFTSTDKIETVARAKNYRMETNQDLLLNYQEKEVNLDSKEENIQAIEINIPYSNYTTTSYTYNADTKLYNRFVNGQAHIDSITKAQYTTKNIIIMKVHNETIDSYGRQTLDNVTEGEGYYITNGRAIPIIFKKSDREAQTKYYDQNGKKLKVNDGNTYIQIIPDNQELTIK